MSAAQLPPMDHAERLERLRGAAGLAGRTGFLVTDPVNVRYLTGFAGSAGMVLVLADDAVLLTDGRYAERAAEELAATGSGVNLQVGRWPEVPGYLGSRADRLLLEAGHVTLEVHGRLTEALPGTEFVPRSGVLEELRLTKDPAEVARLALAARISEDALAATEPMLAGGPTEREFAAALEAAIRAAGAEVSFDSIVAAGPNGAKPHATPSDRPIRPGEMVIVDFGAAVDGYHADLTRMLWEGDLPAEARAVYALALAAQQAGVAAALAGTSHADVDRACRAVVEDAGHADCLLHPSGHNLGLAVHELPYLAPDSDEPLHPGQVITVEPGVYQHGRLGARFEDMVLVTEDQPRVLTTSPKRSL